MEKKKYPIGPENYVLHEEIGQGATASVHRALCVPFNEIVAIKILDFERDNADLVKFLSFCCLNFFFPVIFILYFLFIEFDKVGFQFKFHCQYHRTKSSLRKYIFGKCRASSPDT